MNVGILLIGRKYGEWVKGWEWRGGGGGVVCFTVGFFDRRKNVFKGGICF